MTSRFKKRLTRLHASRQRLHDPRESNASDGLPEGGRVFYADDAPAQPMPDTADQPAPDAPDTVPGTMLSGKKAVPGTMLGGEKTVPGTMLSGEKTVPGTMSSGKKTVPGTMLGRLESSLGDSPQHRAWRSMGARAVETNRGIAYYLQHAHPLARPHGIQPLSAFSSGAFSSGSFSSGSKSSSTTAESTAQTIRVAQLFERLFSFAPDRSAKIPADLKLSQVAFIDLETTGLSAHSYAFCIGIGFIDGDEFMTRQYLMTSAHDESQALQASMDFLEKFTCICTFNGRSFDLPMLRRRWEYHGIPHALDRLPNLDLLRVSRRRFSGRKAHNLNSLERDFLNFHRVDDVPGAKIPPLWKKYLKNGQIKPLLGIFEHNRLDILSMLAFLPVMDVVDGSSPMRGDGVRSEPSGQQAPQNNDDRPAKSPASRPSAPEEYSSSNAHPQTESLRRAYRLRKKSTASAPPPHHSNADLPGADPDNFNPASLNSGSTGSSFTAGTMRRGLPVGARLRELRAQVERSIAQNPHAPLEQATLARLFEILAFAPAHAFALRHIAQYFRHQNQPELAEPFERRLRDISPF